MGKPLAGLHGGMGGVYWEWKSPSEKGRDKVEQYLQDFPVADGHVESILIGAGVAKVCFQTWKCQQLAVIFHEVVFVRDRYSVFADMDRCTVEELDGEIKAYRFYPAVEEEPGQPLLEIHAGGYAVHGCGASGDLNAALFHIGPEYIGGQAWTAE